MNKISLYSLLILFFLGFSKSLSPTAQRTIFIKNERVFSGLFQGAPLSLILIDKFQAGLLIKTYYLKFKVLKGRFNRPQTLIVRTTKELWEKNKENIGMSLFRRTETDQKESLLPMPAGALFIGDKTFGQWVLKDSGQQEWTFNKFHKNYPQFLGWKNFRPTYKFYKAMLIKLKNDQPFYGLNNEFGTQGLITRELFEKSPFRSKKTGFLSLRKLKEYYFTLPLWKVSPRPSLKNRSGKDR